MQPPALVCFEDRADAFLLGCVDEGAGIDDHDVGFIGMGRQGHARAVQVPGDDLGINKVLRAAKRDESDFHHRRSQRRSHGWWDSRGNVIGDSRSL